MEEVIDLEDDDVLGLVSDDDEEVSPPNYHHETTDEPQEQDDDGDAAMLAAAAVAVALGQQEEQAAAKEAERKKRKEKQQKKRKEKGKDKPEHAFLSGAGLEEVDVEAGQSGLMETTYIGETKTKKKKKRKSKKKKRVNPFSSTVVHSWSWSTFYKNPEFRKRMGTVIIAALCCLLGLIFFVVGLVELYSHGRFWAGLTFLIVSLVCLLPGAYSSFSLYKAFKDRSGFNFSHIPAYEEAQ
ncbi:hypothetical protein QOT17_005435 [Balamuthia mandrillaris]